MSAKGESGHAEASVAEPPFVYLALCAGTVLMRESWLRRKVPVNAAKSERLSFSFNYAWGLSMTSTSAIRRS